MSDQAVTAFLDLLRQSLRKGTFVKLSLGKYRGKDPTLRNVAVRRVVIQKESLLSFTYRYQKSDVVKNYYFDESVEHVGALLGTEFRSGHLFTLDEDVQLEFNRRVEARLSVSKPTSESLPDASHDRRKRTHLDLAARHWKALGIGDGRGGIRLRMGDKWKQVNKFVETLASLYAASDIAQKQELTVVDMGSGKGYLTFAAYEYFTSVLGRKVVVRGIEARPELVALCNEVARDTGFRGLSFEQGTIREAAVPEADILIALHACNTATDEALHKGIASGASLIVCAPCCYQEVRPQMTVPESMKGALRHGILLERQAEIVTDALRALLLESEGYSAKVFEFTSPEDTLKNIMISATKRPAGSPVRDVSDEIASLKRLYGIREQALESFLAKRG